MDLHRSRPFNLRLCILLSFENPLTAVIYLSRVAKSKPSLGKHAQEKDAVSGQGSYARDLLS